MNNYLFDNIYNRSSALFDHLFKIVQQKSIDFHKILKNKKIRKGFFNIFQIQQLTPTNNYKIKQALTSIDQFDKKLLEKQHAIEVQYLCKLDLKKRKIKRQKCTFQWIKIKKKKLKCDYMLILSNYQKVIANLIEELMQNLLLLILQYFLKKWISEMLKHLQCMMLKITEVVYDHKMILTQSKKNLQSIPLFCKTRVIKNDAQTTGKIGQVIWSFADLIYLFLIFNDDYYQYDLNDFLSIFFRLTSFIFDISISLNKHISFVLYFKILQLSSFVSMRSSQATISLASRCLPLTYYHIFIIFLIFRLTFLHVHIFPDFIQSLSSFFQSFSVRNSDQYHHFKIDRVIQQQSPKFNKLIGLYVFQQQLVKGKQDSMKKSHEIALQAWLLIYLLKKMLIIQNSSKSSNNQLNDELTFIFSCDLEKFEVFDYSYSIRSTEKSLENMKQKGIISKLQNQRSKGSASRLLVVDRSNH